MTTPDWERELWYAFFAEHTGTYLQFDLLEEAWSALREANEFLVHRQTLKLPKYIYSYSAQNNVQPLYCGWMGRTHYLQGKSTITVHMRGERFNVKFHFGDSPSSRSEALVDLLEELLNSPACLEIRHEVLD